MPQIARVIGTLWATRKYKDLEGCSLRILQPVNSKGEAVGKPFIAADTVGAGLGELVLYVTAYEAVIPYPRDMVPLDASIIAIVEKIYHKDGETE